MHAYKLTDLQLNIQGKAEFDSANRILVKELVITGNRESTPATCTLQATLYSVLVLRVLSNDA